MKRILSLLLLFVATTCGAQTPILPSVAGVRLGDDFDAVIKQMDGRFDKYKKFTEASLVTYYEVDVGGIYYDYASFEYIYKRGRKILNSVRLYSNYELSDLNEAKTKRDYIASVYKKKYRDMEEHRSDDGFKYYTCCFNTDKTIFWIVIELFKERSESGKYLYYTSVSYGPIYSASLEDI